MNRFQVGVLNALEEWAKGADGLLDASYFAYPETEHADLRIGIEYPRGAYPPEHRTHYHLTVKGDADVIDVNPPMNHYEAAASFACFLLEKFGEHIERPESLEEIKEKWSRPSFMA